MPNYCDNSFKVKGKIGDVSEFILQCIGADIVTSPYSDEAYIENFLDFQKIKPMPKDIEDWYSWRLNNWGTKWEVCETHSFNVNKIDKEHIEVSTFFSTAWCPPDKIYDTLLEEYKDTSLEFEIEYYEGGCAFAGHMKFSKGEVLEEEYVEYKAGKRENNIKYYSYLIEHDHESSEWMSEYIYESMEQKGIELSKIEETINRFEEYHRRNKIVEAATIYIDNVQSA